jgi:hypothetical protein
MHRRAQSAAEMKNGVGLGKNEMNKRGSLRYRFV